MRRKYLLGRRFYDVADAGGVGAPAGTGTPAGAGTPAGTGQPAPKVFTQEQVNAILAKEKNSVKSKMEELKTLNQQLKNSSQMTAQERDDLKSKIEEIETSYMSETEKMKTQYSKTEKTLKKQIEDLAKNGDSWKKRFLDAEIKKEILSNANNAINPNQILDLIAHKVEAEIGDDNAINLKIGDKSVKDFISEMENDVDNYGNLFKSKKTGLGLGGKTSKPTGGLSFEEITKQLYGDK